MPGLVLASALAASPWPARAADRPLQVAQYAHTSWTRNSINMGLVFAMAQTPDGYLWIGGSYGLFRFDGLRFAQWQPPDGQSLPAGPYALLVSRDGTLWIGTFYGLASWDGHMLTQYPQLYGRFVASLLEDRDGTVWAGMYANPGQLCAVRAGEARCTAPEGGFGAFVWSLGHDGAGNMWVGADSALWQWGPGMPRRYPLPSPRVGDLSTTADGRVLFGLGGRLLQLAGDGFAPYKFRRAAAPYEWVPEREVIPNKLLRDRDGGLWIGTESRGLVHVKDGKADMFTRADGLSGNISCGLFEDREGNIWYGSDKGLDRFRRLSAATVSTKQGLPDDVTNSVLATLDGGIWAATNDGIARWKDGELIVYKERDGLPSARAQSLYEDADGRLWASTAGGLAYFAGGRFVAVDGGPSDEIYSMTGDATGTLWLAGKKGLARLHHGRIVDNVPWAAFGRDHQAQAIVADRGGVWLSFWDRSGVTYFKDGKIEATYLASEKRGSPGITSVRLDTDGAIWVGTGGRGISRIKDGLVTMLASANGLPCDLIHWSTLDGHGAMWMSSSCGVMRISRDDLAAWIADPNRRVTPKLFTAADGVPPVPAAVGYFNPPVTKGRDGKLWFLSGAELVLIDPDHIRSNPVPPPVHVESVVADHRSYAVANGLRLPPLVRDIAIEFSALTLADPHTTHFRYRLEGHDAEWQEAVDRRLATYTNLPPGDYHFRVKAANNSGVWNEEGARLDFSIRPAFYQTTWFRIACAVVLIALAWGGFQLRLRMRMRRLQQQFEAMLEARVSERTRIARDLHDTLLQRFHGLLLQFQAAFNLLPDRPRESRQILASAIDRVAEAITEGRDTVQGLRTTGPETDDLADSLQVLAEDLANAHGHAAAQPVQVQMRVQGTPRALHPRVRDEAFRIAGEALRNAFRHAAAKRIDVEIGYDERHLRVKVRDDGKGMEAEVLRKGEKKGHFGLRGMRERAGLVGGKLTLRRGPQDTGTEVEFSAPQVRAYSRPSPGRPRLLYRKFAPSEIDE